MFQKILFPVDLTENMYRILPFVIEMAKKFGAQIHCVYSLHISSYYGNIGMGDTYVGEFEANARQEIEMKLDHFIADNFEDKKVQVLILNGRPGNEIVNYAKEKNIDLIIMGHSATGFERAVMGSVSAHVVKYSPSPVMVISPEVLKK